MSDPIQKPQSQIERAWDKALEDGNQAHTAVDWFDIYVGVIEASIEQVLNDHAKQVRPLPLGSTPETVMERLNDFRSRARRLRGEWAHHDLMLTDDLEIEGPALVPDEFGQLTPQWPQGVWIKIFWPSGDHREFRSENALLITNFILWWQNFQLKIGQDKEPERRLVLPDSVDYKNYMAAKKRGE